MKNLSFYITFLLAFFVIPSAIAQNKFALNLGFEGALPMSSGYKTMYMAAGGASIRAQYNVSDNIGVTLSSGALAFIPKEIGNLGGGGGNTPTKFNAMLSIPIKVGGKYYLTKGFYGMVEVGTVINRIISANTSGGNPTVGLGGSFSALSYAPGIGVQFGGFDLGVRYETFSKGGAESFMAARLGFNLFSIK